MGSILQRRRANGSVGYTAIVRIKRDGKVVLSRSATFNDERAAGRWITRVEAQLSKPGALEAAIAPKNTTTIGEVIDRYTGEARVGFGKTKAQTLRTIRAMGIADRQCASATSADVVAMAQELLAGGREPQTVYNYVTHLAAVWALAGPAWGVPLAPDAIRDALVVVKRLGLVSKSKARSRRPTLDEMAALVGHFAERERAYPTMTPMRAILAFAVYSTRRREEILSILWRDVEPGRVLVRDMKHPGEKVGNNVWCELPAEAEAVLSRLPRVNERVFPFSPQAVGMKFTNACRLLGINDLRFHDLRHDGISRLFEIGKTIPQAASVSGHRSWQSLQRYTHVRQTGDKYVGFDWLN